MSLKAFHIVFVIVSTLSSLGFGAWAMMRYRRTGDVWALASGVASFIAVIVLIIYGRWFLKKLRGVSYL